MNTSFHVVIALTFLSVINGQKRPQILLLGDSITQLGWSLNAPWSSLLANQFVRRADVINRGISGYTTRSYLKVLDDQVTGIAKETIAAVTIFLGANDAANHVVPVTEFKSNLKEMVSRLNILGIQTDRLIFITPPPVYNHPERIPEDYVSPVKEVATEVGATFIDIYHRFAKDSRQEKLFSDGLHFSLDGAKLFYSLIKDVVEEKVKNHKM